jgi:hypothetical protein
MPDSDPARHAGSLFSVRTEKKSRIRGFTERSAKFALRSVFLPMPVFGAAHLLLTSWGGLGGVLGLVAPNGKGGFRPDDSYFKLVSDAYNAVHKLCVNTRCARGALTMTSAFSLRWEVFRHWKQGNAAADYEDAGAGNVERGRFAVADGASEASFAGIWAKLLVERFVNDPDTPWRDLKWIGALRQKWSADVDGLPLPWYAEEKRALGAFATFLGLVFRPHPADGPTYWRALAVGDCCLFHTRGGRLKQAFPLLKSADFGNRPELLRSRGDGAKTRHEFGHGRWQTQDRCLLMTDALAQWFLLAPRNATTRSRRSARS